MLQDTSLTLCAVVDPRPDRRAFAEAFVPGISTYETIDALLAGESCDAIIVATTASTHYPVIRKALLHGLDVLAEKPLTTCVEEARELDAIATEKGRILMVAHTFVYNSAVRKLKELLTEGRLGGVYYMRAARTHLGLIREDVNVAWDLASHDIAIFMYLLDEVPDRVQAMGRCIIKPGREDIVFITLGFPSGVVANIQLSWTDANKTRVVEVVGSKAKIIFDDMNMQEPLRIFEKGVRADDSAEPDFGVFKLVYRDGDIVSPKVVFEEPLKTLRDEFVHAVRNRTKPITDATFATHVVETLCKVDAIFKSSSMAS